MSEFDFDRIIDRKGTHSLKWDNPKNSQGKDDILPLWVADMDFAPPPPVLKALGKRLEHPVFGYTNAPGEYFEAVSAWYAQDRRTVATEDLILAPSVMHALSMAVRSFTAPGDRIMAISPIYYPFYRVVRENHRALVEAPLKNQGGVWSLDLVLMEELLVRAQGEGQPVKALLFCAPHNPVGRVWTAGELEALGELVRRFDVLVLSDEIHADWVFPGWTHVSPLDLGTELEARTLVFAGPNKTFNLAGLHISHVIVRNPDLKKTMTAAVKADFYDQPNVFSLTAAWTAYTEGRPWLEAAKAYVWENFGVMKDFFAAHFPGTRVTELQGTYLAWIDVRALLGTELNEIPLVKRLEEEGRVKVSHGSLFQKGGEGHIRINLACPRSLLIEGLDRIRRTLEVKRLG